MSHVFDRYFRKHGHFPHVSITSGVQRLTVEFAPGYVRIQTSSPYSGQVYVTRSAWFTMLKAVIPITRLWRKNPAKDFDVPQRVHQAFLDELALNQEKRRIKKTRVIDPDAMARQHRRWLRAKARSREQT